MLKIDSRQGISANLPFVHLFTVESRVVSSQNAHQNEAQEMNLLSAKFKIQADCIVASKMAFSSINLVFATFSVFIWRFVSG